jgi:hypothetical protein
MRLAQYFQRRRPKIGTLLEFIVYQGLLEPEFRSRT